MSPDFLRRRPLESARRQAMIRELNHQQWPDLPLLPSSDSALASGSLPFGAENTPRPSYILYLVNKN